MWKCFQVCQPAGSSGPHYHEAVFTACPGHRQALAGRAARSTCLAHFPPNRSAKDRHFISPGSLRVGYGWKKQQQKKPCELRLWSQGLRSAELPGGLRGGPVLTQKELRLGSRPVELSEHLQTSHVGRQWEDGCPFHLPVTSKGPSFLPVCPRGESSLSSTTARNRFLNAGLLRTFI